jgi:L-cysteine desulfidase
MDSQLYQKYIAILKHELVPALGCTEPIAIAYAAAKARQVLGIFPEHITLHCSGNIIKNAKGVVVPNSGGMKGIEAASTLGVVGGNPDLKYEVLHPVTKAHIEETKRLLSEDFCDFKLVHNKDNLYILAEAMYGKETSAVEIEREHTNITKIVKNGKVLYLAEDTEITVENDSIVDKSVLNIRGILDFAERVKLEDVQEILERQVLLNTAISEEGLSREYGAEVGKLLHNLGGKSLPVRAASKAAAGSDARMNGCSMPVVINSGSGNQGITVTLPVYEYAKAWGKPDEQMYRALVMANLIAVHIKNHIGNLSAFCGATSAACGAASGIAYMDGCNYEQICMAITNTLSNIGGMVCDGAKSSCAAKVASAVHAGVIAYQMANRNKTFCPGEGLVGRNIEETIDNYGRMGREGMRETDLQILNIMVQN